MRIVILMSDFVVDYYTRREVEGEREVSSVTAESLLVLYPGESGELQLYVHGPRGHVVAVEEYGFPYSVASLEIAPKQAQAPFQVKVIATARVNATPGVYAWGVRVVDITQNRVLGEEPITMVILPRNIPKSSARDVASIREVYGKFGIQIALWTALRLLYPHGAVFAIIKSLYEMITGRTISKGTVGNTLKTMVAKGLLEHRNGIYRAVDLQREVLLSRVNLVRVRYPWQVLKREEHEAEDDRRQIDWEKHQLSVDQLPQPIQRAFSYAVDIAEAHGSLPALYFLVHTLLGVRQTGYLLLWLSDWFIVVEPKTGFAHHFYSRLLHRMLLQLGLDEGIYYRPYDLQYQEARRLAQQYIRRIYGSHQSARRLHYLLWEEGYIWSEEDKVYTVRVYHYPDGEVGIQVLDKTGREEVYGENLRDKLAQVETYTALPCRHVDERNEETYFYRPGGLY